MSRILRNGCLGKVRGYLVGGIWWKGLWKYYGQCRVNLGKGVVDIFGERFYRISSTRGQLRWPRARHSRAPP